ncbi:hypothetical protein BB559_005025 [Furculomyces boomerangus]|uniref:Protein kinase domain-containing protein n=1 Tax=Furculomyces boomerangus TaxID=61424 RepID=A0A2T9YB67_9FUNG|nr:hypothetical protein BB559_005025 [Furculomyces boomerangus]
MASTKRNPPDISNNNTPPDTSLAKTPNTKIKHDIAPSPTNPKLTQNPPRNPIDSSNSSDIPQASAIPINISPLFNMAVNFGPRNNSNTNESPKKHTQPHSLFPKSQKPHPTNSSTNPRNRSGSSHSHTPKLPSSPSTTNSHSLSTSLEIRKDLLPGILVHVNSEPFVINKKLKHGSNANVYLVTSISNEKNFVLKHYSIKDPEIYNRIQGEINILVLKLFFIIL